MRVFALAAVAAMALAGSAMAADQSGSLSLKTPFAKDKIIIDGAIWKCAAETCTATSVKAMPSGRACRIMAGKLGELTAFSYRGEVFSAEALAACNVAAKG